MRIFFSEKIRNSGNAHSFFGKDFYSKPLYWVTMFMVGINSSNPHRKGKDLPPSERQSKFYSSLEQSKVPKFTTNTENCK